jgi:putative FmdB family regulatory protein
LYLSMPIYAYKCDACGHAKDILQKMSDPILTACPHCGAQAFSKQVTAAGFQLKGSGWYVTDFRSGNGGAAAKPADAAADAAKPAADAAPTSAPAAASDSSATKTVAAPAVSTPAKAVSGAD